MRTTLVVINAAAPRIRGKYSESLWNVLLLALGI